MHEKTFFDKYELISSSNDFRGQFNVTIDKVCKFCLKTSKENTFKNIPHVIPELLGKNNYTSNDECDSCNKLFGAYETDLSNYISPYQTLIGQKTKSKIPIFQSRKDSAEKSTTIKYIDGKPNINFNNNLVDFHYDYTNKLISMNLKKKKFIPLNVYKSLVKIGLSLCPRNELEDYKKTIEWLAKNDSESEIVYDIPLNLYRTRFANKYYDKPFASLYKRRFEIANNKYEPKLSLVVCSGVLVFQLFIPFCTETENINYKEYQLVNDLYPAFLHNLDFKGEEKIEIHPSQLPIIKYDMNYSAQVEADEIIHFKYEKLESIK
ncbi:HNH endonuclease [Flavobacterium pectinovorum]|uniref:HNH endonuclease n=1 Tax=Flavobacterium pectinovorum TaxID=29533 RepID=UPI001FABC4E8|nr:HNH endonuclease [Flavobacterium pectinovorum]MCI9843518.1 hypothetical protein [Flavobacterium pectinovorum]